MESVSCHQKGLDVYKRQVEENGFDPEAEAEIEWLKEVIVAVRNIRAESNIAPSKGLDLLFRNLSAENAKILEKQTALLKMCIRDSLS